jgi:mannose-6-phosphate isomerase-like protein (cupin superfamily)
MQYWMTRAGANAAVEAADTVAVLRLFDDARGCEKFAQRLLQFGPGRSRARVEGSDDEVLFVLDGAGTLILDGERVPLRSRVGVVVRCGTTWSAEVDDELELLSVLVRDPETAPGPGHAVVDLAGEDRLSATAARQFTLGVNAEAGCPSVTQFIGFVPPGRAPDHFHCYDEVIYVLDGQGVLHIGGEEAILGPGSCIHLPARLVHSLENTGAGELQLLGVFRPSGSPAEAYYPDGTPAVYPEES